MDKQKTQRIIGILVIIAFVIVLIPLFFGRTEVPVEMSNAKSLSVPVPEQQSNATPELAKNDFNSEGQTPDDSAILGTAASAPVNQSSNQATPALNNTSNDTPQTIANTSDAVSTNASDESKPKNNETPLQNADVNNAAPNTLSTPQSTTESTINETPKEISNQTTIEDESNANLSSTELAKPAVSNPSPIKKHKNITFVKNHHHSTKVKPLNINSNELAKLNSTAWAVQMGNFKDKNNARRLVDKLRVAGYKAFSKEIKSTNGSVSTRVYIGPEFQRTSALKLADKVAHEINIEGIVVSIKPLKI